MSTIEDLALLIDSAFASLTLGTNLFGARLPDDPDIAVAVFEYDAGAGNQHQTMGRGVYAIAPAVQVRVRHTSYPLGHAMATDIWNLFQQQVSVLINGSHYIAVDPINIPTMIERDSHERYHFVANFFCHRSYVSP